MLYSEYSRACYFSLLLAPLSEPLRRPSSSPRRTWDSVWQRKRRPSEMKRLIHTRRLFPGRPDGSNRFSVATEMHAHLHLQNSQKIHVLLLGFPVHITLGGLYVQPPRYRRIMEEVPQRAGPLRLPGLVIFSFTLYHAYCRQADIELVHC